MKELYDLVKALEQYNKSASRKYQDETNSIARSDKCCSDDVDALKEEIVGLIKKHRWEISEGKRQDLDFARHIDRYYIEKDVD